MVIVIFPLKSKAINYPLVRLHYVTRGSENKHPERRRKIPRESNHIGDRHQRGMKRISTKQGGCIETHVYAPSKTANAPLCMHPSESKSHNGRFISRANNPWQSLDVRVHTTWNTVLTEARLSLDRYMAWNVNVRARSLYMVFRSEKTIRDESLSHSASFGKVSVKEEWRVKNREGAWRWWNWEYRNKFNNYNVMNESAIDRWKLFSNCIIFVNYYRWLRSTDLFIQQLKTYYLYP